MCASGERTRDCSPGHAGKEGPQLARTGASHSILKCDTVLGTFDATPKVPQHTGLTPFFEDCTPQNEVPLSSFTKPPGPPSACPLPPRLSLMLRRLFPGPGRHSASPHLCPCWSLPGALFLLCHFLSAQIVCSSRKPSLHTPVPYTPITIMLLIHSTYNPTATVYYHKLLAGRACVFDMSLLFVLL